MSLKTITFLTSQPRPINPDQRRKDYWYAALRAKSIWERDFYYTRHAFISPAFTDGENIKAIAEQCGTSA